MNKIAAFAALLALSGAFSAAADSPAREREYQVWSPNGMYRFTMHPSDPTTGSGQAAYGEAHRVTPDGEPVVAGDGDLLWTVEGWYSFETFLADDGRSLVRIGPWASLPPAEELAVAFYKDGKELRRYVVADLVQDPESLVHSVSHYTWQSRDSAYPRLGPDGIFQLRTIEDRVLTFHAPTGELLGREALQRPPNGATPQVTREDADDHFLASNLFAENDLDLDESRIDRVLRDSSHTIVWVRNEFAGLPVFDSAVGYYFGSNRRVHTDPDSGEPLRLGEPLPAASAFPIDHRPDVSRDDAIDTWLAAARNDPSLGRDYTPNSGPEAVLGFFDLDGGKGNAPVYRLAWRVSPSRSSPPLAMIGAKKGDVLFFDSGAVAKAVSLQQPTSPTEKQIVGRWSGPPCGERRAVRVLVLRADSSFSVLDWGKSSYEGRWQRSTASIIELHSDAAGRRNVAPLPRALGFEPASGALHEATPGAATLCRYTRLGELP